MRHYLMYAAMGCAMWAGMAATKAHAQTAALPALLPPLAEDTSFPSAADTATVQVPVLKQPLQRGQTITADNIIMANIPAAKLFASTVAQAEELAGQQAIRPLESGKPISRLHVRVTPMVSRNQVVTLVYRKGGIELSGSAQALEDGQQGDSIRVLNPATRSTLTGTVTAAGTIEMN